MCLISFAINSHPKYKLILAANRDEFYDRPTASAHFWNSKSNILAGKDLKEGGTWLGINKDGRIAAITNYRDPKNIKLNAPSRGFLVKEFLSKNISNDEFTEGLKISGNKYNGFNLIFGTIDDLRYYSNQINKVVKLQSGIYGLSNHLLNTPWPKVEKVKNYLAQNLNGEINIEELLELLSNEHQFDDDQLPDTGVGIELERKLSPIFIKSDKYGTRSSTIILVDYDGNVNFTERTYEDKTEENRFNFKLSS